MGEEANTIFSMNMHYKDHENYVHNWMLAE